MLTINDLQPLECEHEAFEYPNICNVKPSEEIKIRDIGFMGCHLPLRHAINHHFHLQKTNQKTKCYLKWDSNQKKVILNTGLTGSKIKVSSLMHLELATVEDRCNKKFSGEHCQLKESFPHEIHILTAPTIDGMGGLEEKIALEWIVAEEKTREKKCLVEQFVNKKCKSENGTYSCVMEENHEGNHHDHNEKNMCRREWENGEENKNTMDEIAEPNPNCPAHDANLDQPRCQHAILTNNLVQCARERDHPGNHHWHTYDEPTEETECLLQWNSVGKIAYTTAMIDTVEENICGYIISITGHGPTACQRKEGHIRYHYNKDKEFIWETKDTKYEEQADIEHDGLTISTWWSGRQRSRNNRCPSRNLTSNGHSTVQCSRIADHEGRHHSHNDGSISGKCLTAWERHTPTRERETEPTRSREYRFETTAPTYARTEIPNMVNDQLLTPIEVKTKNKDKKIPVLLQAAKKYNRSELFLTTIRGIQKSTEIRFLVTPTTEKRKTMCFNKYRVVKKTTVYESESAEKIQKEELIRIYREMKTVKMEAQKYMRRMIESKKTKFTHKDISKTEVEQMVEYVRKISGLKTQLIELQGIMPVSYDIYHKKAPLSGPRRMIGRCQNNIGSSMTDPQRSAAITKLIKRTAREGISNERAATKDDRNILVFTSTGRIQLPNSGRHYEMKRYWEIVEKITRLEKRPLTQERHVGIEIELISKLETKGLAEKLVKWEKHVNLKLDGSIRPNREAGYPYSSELNIVIPIKKLHYIGRILRAIRPYCAINESCGLHIHIDYRGKSQAYLQRAYRGMVIAHRAILNDTLTADRRDNNYAMPNKHIDLEKQKNSSMGRYCQVNPEAYEKYKTLEIRSHAGTLNPIKIINWIHVLLLAEKTYMHRTPSSKEKFMEQIKATSGLKKYMMFRTEVLKEHPEAAEFQLIREAFVPRIPKPGAETEESRLVEREANKRISQGIKAWMPMPAKTLASNGMVKHASTCPMFVNSTEEKKNTRHTACSCEYSKYVFGTD